jgi:hypothetical protein
VADTTTDRFKILILELAVFLVIMPWALVVILLTLIIRGCAFILNLPVFLIQLLIGKSHR